MDYEVGKEIVSFDAIRFPKVLYKYRNWEKENNRTILTKREVYFASPSSFDDPYDCKIPIRWDLLTYEDICNKYFEDSKVRNTHFHSVQDHMLFAIEMANTSPINNPEIVRQHQVKSFEEYNKRAGVLSLTEFCQLKKMWEEYSNNHRGFCVGFNPQKMLRGMQTSGGKVIYHSELPIIYPSPKHSFELQMNLQVYSKLKIWEFEQEYRTHKFNYNGLNHERKQIVPVDAYEEIILGAAMPTDLIENLLSSLPKELAHVKIKKAKIINDDIIIEDFKGF